MSDSLLSIDGGSIRGEWTLDNSTATVSSGTLDESEWVLKGTSSLELAGLIVMRQVTLKDSSSLSIPSGRIDTRIVADDYSTIYLEDLAFVCCIDGIFVDTSAVLLNGSSTMTVSHPNAVLVNGESNSVVHVANEANLIV
ncbi:MAG: hypothetical protein KDB23_31265, partial [Planctomycetales bacterium]|nr:hypothetical protein [Planctomycetales bacterium]